MPQNGPNHCMKSVWDSGKYGKIRTIKTPNTDTFHAVHTENFFEIFKLCLTILGHYTLEG